MKLKSLFLIIFCTLFIVGCSTEITKENRLTLPEGIPDFVKGSDFEKIDWDKKAAVFNGDILGNKDKSGVIGVSMTSINIDQKWMWHIWDNKNLEKSKLTAVSFHRETETVHPILKDGWTIGLDGKNNGADAHAVSFVNIPKAGEWAVLLYIDGELFDILVYEIKE